MLIYIVVYDDNYNDAIIHKCFINEAMAEKEAISENSFKCWNHYILEFELEQLTPTKETLCIQ